MHHVIGAYGMPYSEYKEMYRKAWRQRFYYLCSEIGRNKNEGK